MKTNTFSKMLIVSTFVSGILIVPTAWAQSSESPKQQHQVVKQDKAKLKALHKAKKAQKVAAPQESTSGPSSAGN